jgi:hypothetical protein
MLNLGLGVNSRHSVSLYDADAQAFINATALTGTTEKTAVNNLVKNLKSYGLWSKMKAIYPFVSDTVNLLSYSEDFSNTTFWTTPNCIVTPNFATAPNGTTTADKILPNVSSGGFVEMQYTASITSGTTYTYSQYVKANGYNYIQFIGSAAGFGTFYINYDIVNGVETAFSQGTTVGTITRSIESVGNGWFRVSASVPAQATGSYRITLDIIPASNSVRGVAWTSDGVSSVLYWGAQLETGALTTYQPIATTPANRFVSQFKYNLKDARDLNAAFRLAFNGTWTYSKQGATPNGVNGYANTYFNANTNFVYNDLAFGGYTPTTTNDSGYNGAYPSNYLMHSFYSYNQCEFYTTDGNKISTVTGQSSLVVSNQSGTAKNLYSKGISVTNGTNTTGTSLPNYNMYIGAANNAGTAAYFDKKQLSFYFYSTGLNATEQLNLYTSVQLYQQALSRYTGVPIVSDANAQAFLDAAVITDQTQANAVNTLVTDLKTYGLWAKMKAIYPFVGGTASTHKWNLKDPRDLDAAYRLAFSGAWTHSSTGALPNGTNAFADSFLIPNTALGSTFSLSYYSNTNTLATSANTCEIGAFQSGSQMIGLSLRRNLNSDLFGTDGYGLSALSTSTTSNFFGIVSRSSTTSLKLWKNTTLAATNTSTDTGSKPTIKVTLALNNGLTGYSNRQCAFSHIGDGLSDTEVADLYTAVQKFNTTLTRNN